jgi:hypothetical protein
MPFYPFNSPPTVGGNNLRAGLGKLQSMTAAQAAVEYGFASGDAAAAKAELESAIAKLLSDAAGVNSAVVQALNFFG